MVFKMKFVTVMALLPMEVIAANLMNRAYSHLWAKLSDKVLQIWVTTILNDYDNYFSTEILPANTEGANAFYNIINNIHTFLYLPIDEYLSQRYPT